MNIHRLGMAFAFVVFVVSAAADVSAEPDANDLLDRADLLLRLGVAEQGAGRSFDEAGALLDKAAARIAHADVSAVDRAVLTREVDAVRDDLEILTELFSERFYGVFPLTRLTVSTLTEDEGLAVSEQLFHPPDIAAVLITTRKLLNQLDDYDHPHVVFRSSPTDRRLENIAAEVLLRDDRSTPHMRRALVEALSAEELAAFDRGELAPSLIERLLTTFDAVSLLILTVRQPEGIPEGSAIFLNGDFYTPGEVVQGSPMDASPVIRMVSFEYIGFTLDRRNQLWPIRGIELLLFGLSLIWAARVKWSINEPLKLFLRVAIGATLFVFGRIFMVAAMTVSRKYIPESTSMVAAAWWWPAQIGLLAILGGGLVAWIVQARLTDIIPGARGARAVGSIFALTSLGACSYFTAPLLLLDESRGLINLVPFVAAGLCLALLFGFAVRTGPPVPHYFAAGSLVLAPILGVCLFTASPRFIFFAAGATGILCLAAWIRHRIVLSRGTEEPELTDEEAAQADQNKLIKLGEKFKKR